MTFPDLTRLPLGKKRAILAALGKGKAPASLNGDFSTPSRIGVKPLDFSLLFFSESASDSEQDRYFLVRECARFADEHGFKAIWVPERHFHRFGAIYPSPAILAAALAGSTRNIRLRAGSVVLPLVDPLRVVEDWAMVDNLSGGRVDISFASGWNPNDFVFSPETFSRMKEVLSERIHEVRSLWRGEMARRKNGKGEWVEVQPFPKPVQPELNAWFTAAGNPKSFEEAGKLGCNLLTMLFSSSMEELAGKILAYRNARNRAEIAGEGCVTLMMHAFVERDAEFVQEKVRLPFLNYIRSSLDVQRQGQEAQWSEKQLDQMAGFAYERYYRTAALFGTPESCQDILKSASDAGVNEIACQVDFGIDAESVLKSLTHLKALKENHELSLEPARIRNPDWKTERGHPTANHEKTPVQVSTDEIAIIGMSGRFPQADNLDEYWDVLVGGRTVFSTFPLSRGPVKGTRFQGGFLKDIEGFDADGFGLSARESALMDPHQRLFLEAARDVIHDAGYDPKKLAGSKTGVWVAMYSPDYNQRLAGATEVDGESLTGRLHVMVANRVSHLLDLRGPSEIVDTACSSSLVAIDRAMQSIRSGECDMAVAGGVSLLLSPVSTQWLGAVEMLSSEGACRPFDPRASGLIRGEGVGAILLKPLHQAVKDGDAIYAVVRGCGTNHNGGREGALTTPSLSAQADLLTETYEKGKIDPGSIRYVEAHGSASELGDYVEVSAFKRAFAKLSPQLPARSCGIGTVKATIGALDAAGGIAGVIKVLLALEKETWPGMPGDLRARPDLELDASPFYLAGENEAWRRSADFGKGTPRRAAVHAFGLGGVNAHVVLEEYVHLNGAAKTHSARRTQIRSAVRQKFPIPYKESDGRFSHALIHRIQPRPDGAVIRTWLNAGDPLVSGHQLRGRAVIAAALMCEMARAAGQVFELGDVHRLEGICFQNPIQFDPGNAEIETRLEVQVNENAASFKLLSGDGSLHAEGTLGWTRESCGNAERIDTQNKKGRELDASQFYDRLESFGIVYGSLYRTVRSVTFNENEAFARIAVPPGSESSINEYGLHPGLLDAVLQLSSVFSRENAKEVQLPFCLEVLEYLAPMSADGFAFLRKKPRTSDTEPQRFDGGVTDLTGRILVRLSDLCLRPARSESESSLEDILKQVESGELSVERAEELLAGFVEASSPVTRFAAELAARLSGGQISFQLCLEDETWNISVAGGRATVSAGIQNEGEPVVSLTREHFEELLAGQCDPTVLFLQGAVRLDPENSNVIKQKIGGFWFEKFNRAHLLPAFCDHLISKIFARGEVILPSGLRRDVFPWTISAQVGGILYDLILREKAARTLEIGMAYGLSSLFICQAHHEKKSGEHVAIDPCQREEFLSIGLDHVAQAGLASYLRFVEDPDYIALPRLLAEVKPFQLIFIDGLHMFDYTLLDFFYADRLLTEGGILIFDDCLAPGVARAVDFVKANRQYEPLPLDCPRLAAFRKISRDNRSLENPNFHREF